MSSPITRKFGILTVALLAAHGVQAGPPFNNLEGVGGVAFNPLAYTAGQPVDTNGAAWYSKPQVGSWYANLPEKHINWEALGIAETIGGRLELSYGYEAIRLGNNTLGAGAPAEDVSKNSYGAKLLVIRENEGGLPYVPAVAVGSILRTTDYNVVGPNRAGSDYYLVATKLITQTPVPLLLSGGLLDTDEEVTGVLGNNKDHDLTWFGNVDIIPVSCIATGFEYKQGARFDTFKNANYWDAHVAYFAAPNLTFIGAYTFTGDHNSSSAIGLGGGLVLSAQYAF